MRSATGALVGTTARGFTLFETLLVIGVLGLVSAAIMRLQSGVSVAQAISRDEVSGVELQRACAERILTVRRTNGYSAPQASSAVSPTCNNLTGTGTNPSVGGYAANPTVTMTDANGVAVSSCTGTVCNVSITVSKTSGPASVLAPVVLQLSSY